MSVINESQYFISMIIWSRNNPTNNYTHIEYISNINNTYNYCIMQHLNRSIQVNIETEWTNVNTTIETLHWLFYLKEQPVSEK